MENIKLKKFLIILLIGIPVILGIFFAVKTTKEHKSTEKKEEETVIEREDYEVNTSTEISKKTDPDNEYLKYIPVYFNGEEKNLYDLATEDEFIFYLQRPDCDDCIKYDSDILKLLSKSKIAYLVIETSKEPETKSGISMRSSVATDIGIEAVPSFIFMKDGKAIEKYDEDFGDGSEVNKIIHKLYKTSKKDTKKSE